jgi:hypothetical protein
MPSELCCSTSTVRMTATTPADHQQRGDRESAPGLADLSGLDELCERRPPCRSRRRTRWPMPGFRREGLADRQLRRAGARGGPTVPELGANRAQTSTSAHSSVVPISPAVHAGTRCAQRPRSGPTCAFPPVDRPPPGSTVAADRGRRNVEDQVRGSSMTGSGTSSTWTSAFPLPRRCFIGHVHL